MILGGRHALAAAIAYYGLLSFFPLVLLSLSVLGYVFPVTALAEQLVRLIENFLPGSGPFLAHSLYQLVIHRSSIGFIALITLYWSASGAVAALGGALDQVWGTPERLRHRSVGPGGTAITLDLAGLWRRLRALALVLGLVALFALSVLATTYVKFTAWLNSLSHVGPLELDITSGLISVVPLVGTAAVFMAVYALIPSRRPPWRALWTGTITASLLFELSKSGFAWYIAQLRLYAWVHASVTTAIVLLLWFYVVATVLIFGAEVGYVASEAKVQLRAAGGGGGEGGRPGKSARR